MVVFSVMGEEGANCLGRRTSLLGASRHPSSTLFRDNAYIRALNFVLIQESRAAQSYLRVSAPRTILGRLETVSEDHRRAARDVVRLITLNSGLPLDHDGSLVSPASVLISLFAVMPEAMGQKATMKTLDLVERRLVQQYTKVLRIAPASDCAILLGLQKKAGNHRDTLRAGASKGQIGPR